MEGKERDMEMEEEEERTEILRDRFRLSAIAIMEAEGAARYSRRLPISVAPFSTSFPLLCSLTRPQNAGRKQGMEISEPVVACIADLAFKFSSEALNFWEIYFDVRVVHDVMSKRKRNRNNDSAVMSLVLSF